MPDNDNNLIGPSYGACCYGDTCVDGTTQDSCEGNGGTYFGDGSVCPQDCPEPGVTGACCPAGSENCIDTTEVECHAMSGVYYGDGVVCWHPDVNCALEEVGACCHGDDEFCFEGSRNHCDQIGGDFQGNGSLCKFAPCGQPDPDERMLLIKNDRDEWEDKDSRSYVIRGRQYVLAGEDADQSCDCCEPDEPPPPGTWCENQGCNDDRFTAVRVTGSIECKALPWLDVSHRDFIGGWGCEGYYPSNADEPTCHDNTVGYPFSGSGTKTTCDGMNDQYYATDGVGTGQPCNLTFTIVAPFPSVPWAGFKLLDYGDCLSYLMPGDIPGCGDVGQPVCTLCDYCRYQEEENTCCWGSGEKHLLIHVSVGGGGGSGHIGCPPEVTCNDCLGPDPWGKGGHTCPGDEHIDLCACGGCSACGGHWWPNDGVWDATHTSDGQGMACYGISGSVRSRGFCDEMHAWRCQYDYCNPNADDCPGSGGLCNEMPGRGQGSGWTFMAIEGTLYGGAYGVSTSTDSCDITVVNRTSNDAMSDGGCGKCPQESIHYQTSDNELIEGCEYHCGCDGEPSVSSWDLGPGGAYGKFVFRTLEFLTFIP